MTLPVNMFSFGLELRSPSLMPQADLAAVVLAVLKGLLSLLGALSIWSWLRQHRAPTELPSAGTVWESLTKSKEVLHRVYQNQLRDNQPYALRGIFGDSVVLPPSMLPWLTSQPESQLSAKWAQMDALNIPTTFLRPDIGLNPVHEPLIRRNLTAHLDSIAGDIQEEVKLSLEKLWGSDTEGWREVNLDYTIRRVVARASNRVFVGSELCRDSDYIENSIRYVDQVSISGLLMNLFPSWFKRPLGTIFTIPVRMSYSKCAKHLLPLFSNLVRSEGSSSPNLFSSWLVSNSAKYPSSSPERTPDFLSRRIMALNFAAIHTSTLTTCNLLLDIASRPSAVSLLRDEALSSSTRWGEAWNRGRLNQMSRLDSAFRESSRLWGLVAKAMSRKVIHASGTILPTGQRLSQGATVCVSGWGLHHDESVYPRPFEFVHDRFMADSEGDAENTAKTAAETDVQYAAWSIGKHACPGRFFAIDLIKIILIHVLMDYEVQLAGERPQNVWVEYNVIPPPGATMSVRRRKETAS